MDAAGDAVIQGLSGSGYNGTATLTQGQPGPAVTVTGTSGSTGSSTPPPEPDITTVVLDQTTYYLWVIPSAGVNSDNGAVTGLVAEGTGTSSVTTAGATYWHVNGSNDAITLGYGNTEFYFSQDIDVDTLADGQLQVAIRGIDIFRPQTGKIESGGPDTIAVWFIDTDYNEESFFVRQAYFPGTNDPYQSLKRTLKAEIDEEAWESLRSDTSRPFPKPKNGRIAVKVINHLGDEVMKVIRV